MMNSCVRILHNIDFSLEIWYNLSVVETSFISKGENIMSDIIFLAEVICGLFLVFFLLRLTFLGQLSIGAGQGKKPEKDKKSPYGIVHFFNCIIQGLNPVTGEPSLLLLFLKKLIFSVVSFVFCAPNWIWGHWIKRKWLQNLCTIVFWCLLALVLL